MYKVIIGAKWAWASPAAAAAARVHVGVVWVAVAVFALLLRLFFPAVFPGPGAGGPLGGSAACSSAAAGDGV